MRTVPAPTRTPSACARRWWNSSRSASALIGAVRPASVALPSAVATMLTAKKGRPAGARSPKSRPDAAWSTVTVTLSGKSRRSSTAAQARSLGGSAGQDGAGAGREDEESEEPDEAQHAEKPVVVLRGYEQERLDDPQGGTEPGHKAEPVWEDLGHADQEEGCEQEGAEEDGRRGQRVAPEQVERPDHARVGDALRDDGGLVGRVEHERERDAGDCRAEGDRRRTLIAARNLLRRAVGPAQEAREPEERCAAEDPEQQTELDRARFFGIELRVALRRVVVGREVRADDRERNGQQHDGHDSARRGKAVRAGREAVDLGRAVLMW